MKEPVRIYCDETGNGSENGPCGVGLTVVEQDCQLLSDSFTKLRRSQHARYSESGEWGHLKHFLHAGEDDPNTQVLVYELLSKSVGIRFFCGFNMESDNYVVHIRQAYEHLFATVLAKYLHEDVEVFIEQGSDSKLFKQTVAAVAQSMKRDISIAISSKADVPCMVITDYSLHAIQAMIKLSDSQQHNIKNAAVRNVKAIEPIVSYARFDPTGTVYRRNPAGTLRGAIIDCCQR